MLGFVPIAAAPIAAWRNGVIFTPSPGGTVFPYRWYCMVRTGRR